MSSVINERESKLRPPEHRVLDAVISQDGKRYILYGLDAYHAGWFALSDLQRCQADVFTTLSSVGVQLIAGASRERFKRQVEQHEHYREAPVAAHPGWVADNLYVTGDGEVIAIPRLTKNPQVLVALKKDPRFASHGSLQDWKDANMPFLCGQPLVQLIYSFSLVGFLMGFAPPDFQNPILELVGDTGKGKTSLAVGAGSICGGNPENQNGYGLSWDRTNGPLDNLLRQHRDNLLILNENNLAGDDAPAQANFMRVFIMRFTEPGERETLNTLTSPVFSRSALLSTSNACIADLIDGSTKSDHAMRSRVITFAADRKFGIFDSVPVGFADSSEAARAMVSSAQRLYGTAGREFVRELCRYKRAAVTRAVEVSFRQLKRSDVVEHIADERQLKTLALCRTAYGLGRRFKLFPDDYGSFDKVLERLISSAKRRAPFKALSAREAVVTYMRSVAADLIDVADLAKPLTKVEFERSIGFWIEGGTKCIVTPFAFNAIANHRVVLKELGRGGELDAEQGRTTKKVPSAICHPSENCRGHFLKIPRADVY